MSGKKRTLSTSSNCSESEAEEASLTRCSALLTLKLEGGDLTTQQVKKAAAARLAEIENQYMTCQEMIKIHKKGSREEAMSQRRAERLLKEKSKVSFCI